MTQDPLWAESTIARYLGRLLPALSTQDSWDRAIRVVDGATELIFYLAADCRPTRRDSCGGPSQGTCAASSAMSEPGSRSRFRYRMGNVPPGRG